MPLLRTLSRMAAHEGPPHFFNFGGGAGQVPTGIACQGPLRPLPRGYTWAAWLRVENGREVVSLPASPRAAAGAAALGSSTAAAAAPAARAQRVLAALLSRQADAVRGVGLAMEGG